MRFPTYEFQTKCIAEARKKAEARFTDNQCTKEEVEEALRRTELDVSGRVYQAELGVHLCLTYGWRAEGVGEYETKPVVSKDDKLQMDKKANVITLTGVKIFFPKVGEQGEKTIVGTLEAHVNGFFYATCNPSFHFHFHFLYTNVKKAFFRVEDEKRPPLLHFHLYHPIKVGAEKTRNIQFHLVQTPVGQRDCYNGSDKIVEDLKNFVLKVDDKWFNLPVFCNCYPFDGAELHKKDEFQGNLPSKAPTVFALNMYSLVALVDEPFIVVHLMDIEIVNLRKKPAPGLVDMTVIFKDLKCEPVYINSIALASLDHMKDQLNCAEVKYFESDRQLDWDGIVKERAASPREFYKKNGWSAYDLEDPITLAFYDGYRAAYSEIICESGDECGCESEDGCESGDGCESEDDGCESEDDCKLLC
ncbi:hypothetical protein MKX01_024633 [Papaver californicum]|nr:hypothetical protein MKX01_024633 [Papaver californicum]